MRGKAAPTAADGPPAIVPAPRLAPTEATRRWAALLQQLFDVDPLACPSCHGAMRIVAFITQTSVIDQILTHLRARPAPAAHAGAPPHRRGPQRAGARHAPHASPPTPGLPPEDAVSDAPRPRGGVRRARRSHRTVTVGPAGLRRPRVTRPDRRPNSPRGTLARWRSRRRPLPGAREAADRRLYSSDPD